MMIRNIILILALSFLCFLTYQGYFQWQSMRELKRVNLNKSCEINKIKNDIHNIEPLKDVPLGGLEENYQYMDQQGRFFSRVHDLSVSFNLQSVDKNGLLSQIPNTSQWEGIGQISAEFKFENLKGLDQFLLVFEFIQSLETMRWVNVVNITQRENLLVTKIQIYGRGL